MPLKLTFRNAPIRQKLMFIIMATTVSAMVLACLGILGFDSILFKANLGRDLSALTRIVAENSTASLQFDDAKSATETLNALRARTHLVAACLFMPDGTMLAHYDRPGSRQPCPPPHESDDVEFRNADVAVSHGVVLQGKRLGTLMLLYDLQEITERRELYGSIVVGVLIVSGLIAFLLSSELRAGITEPVAQLVRATTAVKETNDYSIRARKISGDEVGVLADGFNSMLAGIQSRDNSLRQALADREEALREVETARERFRFLAESMPQKIFTASPSGVANYFNQQWIDFSGLSFEQLRVAGWMPLLHPDDRETDERIWRRSLVTGEPFQLQHRFLRADGEYRWHLTRVHAMRDSTGKISVWIGSDTDIHEQKEAEEELRRANDDLQQFAYSASHDLQEPVRNVAVYSELIARRYHDILDDDGRRALGFLTEGGRRLAMLISDLLAYTRAGTTEGQIGVQDATAVLQLTLDSLAEAIRESGAIVTNGPLPEIEMREVHLQQLLQNLIGNAIKYRRDEAPRIHVSAQDLGAAWRFSIQDNGIGINPQYREKIFGVFKRLHRDEKYDGTGIGLAICQRIVVRYGGRIWVDSEPGKGSTFCFTVPYVAGRTRSAPAESAAG